MGTSVEKERMESITLPPEKASVSRARQYVSDALVAEGVGPATREPAVLLTSELITNGILHGGTEVELRLELTQDALRVEVADSGRGCPVMEAVLLDAEQGRGLMIVSRLASRWGVELASTRTAVWFELRFPRSRDPRHRREPLDAVAAKARRFIRRISPS